MNNSPILKEIETENFIWIIYLFLIGLSFLANKFEKDYYINGNITDKEKYRIINIFVFTVALIIYIYFFKGNIDTVNKLNCDDSYDKIFFNKLNLFSTSLIVIAGIIFLYIAINDKNLETEISFN
ncbi:MAG: hypothetical protein IJA30_06210 [Bacilli bacterium]|nr:hypothetical protein [Bacilli bacterium]